ncbi:MAG: phospholipase effector Tle1 domain-containing protein, partial [Mycobacteriales bacterium]
LAGLVSKCGLLKAGSPVSLKQLYDRYRKGHAVHTIRELVNVPAAERTFEENWLLEYSQRIPVFFQGVYDTVGALGVPFGDVPLISRSNYSFLETDLRINETLGFHALAIDEHREAFAPTLWVKSVQKNVETYAPRPLEQVEQRWFVGAHADVGGGYANGILAQIPLRWLMQKAQVHGLVFRDTVVIDGDEAQGEIHDSFAEMAGGVYRACKFFRPFYRAIGAAPLVTGDVTTSSINETIDGSVFDRCRSNSTYRPRNLTAWAGSRDLTSIQGSVRTDDPTVMIP